MNLLTQNGFDLGMNTGSFQNLKSLLDLLTKFDGNFKSPAEALGVVTSLEEEAKHYDKDLRRLCQNAIVELGDVQDKSAEVASNIKAVNVETKKVQQELKANKPDDQSGYLDASTIEAYGNAIDKVLGNIAQKQEDINAKRQQAINLEKDILSNTTSTREGLSRELEEYTKVLSKFDTEKITKLAASLKETRVAAEYPVPAEQLQQVQTPTQSAKKKGPVKLDGGNIPGFNEGLKNDKKKTEETTIPIKGKVTITDADIAIDVKNPVKIPGVAVVDPSAVQIGSGDDLQKNADALASAKNSLQGIVNKASGYTSNISSLGPAFQYVAQEVDNLSHSLENQIIDFDRISEQTNAYIGKAGSISIDTSNVAVTGEPAAITGKVVLGTEDVVSPETPVDIKGHVELKTTDITPPSEPVELQGKISKTTMESVAKGKKKKGQDIEKPEVVELNGHVKLEDKDIERPDPVVMNGKVVVTKNNINLPEGGIDVKGNLILKNAEIANAIKEAAGKESGKKDASAASGNETNEKSFNRAGKEAHLGYLVTKMGENDTYWQSAISKGNSKKRALYGSLQGVDFKNIDELIAKLNTLPAQSDTYAETLKEIDTLWQEIKKKVDAVNESEKQAAKKQTAKIRDVKNILTAQRQNKNLIETVRGNNGSGEKFYSQLSEKQSKLNLLFEAIDGASDSEQALKA